MNAYLERIRLIRPRRLLHPELVHAGERVRIRRFERVPAVQIVERPVLLGEEAGDAPRRRFGKFEADESQILRGEKRFDLGNCRAVLLYMKEQVAALTGGEKVVELGQPFQRRRHEILAAAADVGRARTVAACGDELARFDDRAASALAVE